MNVKRTIVDKSLGVFGMAGCAGLALVAVRSLGTKSVVGTAGGGMSLLASTVMFYFGWLLLRYPAERLSAARDIARDAEKQGGPLTPRWKG